MNSYTYRGLKQFPVDTAALLSSPALCPSGLSCINTTSSLSCINTTRSIASRSWTTNGVFCKSAPANVTSNNHHHLSLEKLDTTFKREMHRKGPRRNLKVRNAARKRFRVTGTGKIKCFPSPKRGKSLIFAISKAPGTKKNLKVTLTNRTHMARSMSYTAGAKRHLGYKGLRFQPQFNEVAEE